MSNFIGYDRKVQMALTSIETIVLADGNEGFIDNLSAKIGKQLGTIKTFFQSATVDLEILFTSDETKKLHKRIGQKELHVRNIPADKFNKILDSRTITVVGLKTYVQLLLSELTLQLEDVKKNSDDILDDTDTIVSSFLADEQFRKTFAKQDAKQKKAVEKNESIKDSLKKHIDVNDHADIKTVGDVVGNLKGLQDGMRQWLLNDNIMNAKDLDKLMDSVGRINDKVIELVKMLDRSDILATAESVLALKRSISATATYITLISTVYYLNVRSGQVIDKVYEIQKKS